MSLFHDKCSHVLGDTQPEMIPTSSPGSPRRKLSVPDWLAARQDYGMHPRPRGLNLGKRRRRLHNSLLSSKIAWNPLRMQNMILAVGPGTPASLCWQSREESQEDEDPLEMDDDDDDDNDSDDDDDDEEEDEALAAAARRRARARSGEHGENDDSDMEDENEEADDDGGEQEDLQDAMDEEASQDEDEERVRVAPRRRIPFRNAIHMLRRRIQELGGGDDHDHHHPSNGRRGPPGSSNSDSSPKWFPSMRHAGCINTACWLDSPWRLSCANQQHTPSSLNAGTCSSTIIQDSRECPTQLITSGDDRLVKVWDVRDAMGSASPLPGGWDTFSPFGSTSTPSPNLKSIWSDYYRERSTAKVAGSVMSLATMSTGHRGNVFHVAPVDVQPGKILTCGADGFLFLCDLSTATSSVVVHPYVADSSDREPSFVVHSGMAYSHLMLSASTGLLCSERGLHRFDLRLSPREQPRQSLFESILKDSDQDTWSNSTCKSCTIWSPYAPANEESFEANYVFAGGSSPIVGLLDLRMDGHASRVLERYKPNFMEPDAAVSVSGLDVSKDGNELLVSYESDQIYSFPILSSGGSPAGTTMGELDACAEFAEANPETYFPQLAAFGGHLNRFTFLKNAKYAGPMDDYICTGSDSGHAWIFERKSGTVVSFLGADSCTCNGVIPHPSMPFFITYGIDSTAKLWRATLPVDPTVDCSPAGRYKTSVEAPFDISPVTKSWDGVYTLLQHFDEPPFAMPDFIASSEEIANIGRFSSPCRRGMTGYDSPVIGNSLRVLPHILRQNNYECYRAVHEGMDKPIDQHPVDFTHQMTIIRLRCQAEKLGVGWNANIPWAFDVPEHLKIHPADLVPDNPSDWLLHDARLRVGGPAFASPRNHLLTCYSPRYADIIAASLMDEDASSDTTYMGRTPWLDKADLPVEQQQPLWPTIGKEGEEDAVIDEGEEDPSCQKGRPNVDWSRKIIYDTVLLLKEGGNQALKEGLLKAAARRYDKAIQYCAVAFLKYSEGTERLPHIVGGHSVEDEGKGAQEIVVWSPLLRLLISTRLNMGLLLLKPEFNVPRRAADQARAALSLLAPFTREQGKIITSRTRKKPSVVKANEPKETYQEAKVFEAKAYYRLGSAELEMGDYAQAVKNLEHSIQCTLESSQAKPDPLVSTRLHEAKRKLKCKKKRDRAKFRQVLNCSTEEKTDATDD